MPLEEMSHKLNNMSFIRKYIEKKFVNKRLKQILDMGDPCCELHPIRASYKHFEKESKGFIAFDFIILDQEVARGLKPPREARDFNNVIREINSDFAVKNYKKTAKEINLGTGADWYHVLVNGIAENQTLNAAANLVIFIELGKWIIKAIKKFNNENLNVKIGPASARMIAFAEVAKQKNFKSLDIISESEGPSQGALLETDYFILVRGQLEDFREDGSPLTLNYIVRISCKAEILKIVSLDK